MFRLLIAASLTFPALCEGATSTWEAFDYKNCKHWTVTSDYGESGPRFERAKQLLERLNQAGDGKEAWHILEAWVSSERTPYFGVCTSEVGIAGRLLTCHPGTEFPVAGATIVMDGGRMTAKCISGCDKVPFGMLYWRGYEDGPDSRYLAPATRKFRKLCGPAL